MFEDDPNPKPADPAPPQGQKETPPDQKKPPHQFDDWALI